MVINALEKNSLAKGNTGYQKKIELFEKDFKFLEEEILRLKNE